MNIIKGKISKEDLLAERADHQLILHEAKVELEKTRITLYEESFTYIPRSFWKRYSS